jgi:hypothetical protein
VPAVANQVALDLCMEDPGLDMGIQGWVPTGNYRKTNTSCRLFSYNVYYLHGRVLHFGSIHFYNFLREAARAPRSESCAKFKMLRF